MPRFNLERMLESPPDKTREIVATMIAPADQYHGDQFVMTCFYQWFESYMKSEFDKQIQIPSFFRKIPSHNEILKRTKRDLEEGQIVGQILMILLWMNQTGKKVSKNMANKMIEKMNIRDSRFSIPTKRSKLIEYWNKFKNVSHLWCGVEVFTMAYFGYHKDKIDDLYVEWWNDPHIDIILSLSEQFRVFAETTVIGTSKTFTPILQESETWKIPPEYKLPQIPLFQFTSEIPELETSYALCQKKKKSSSKTGSD